MKTLINISILIGITLLIIYSNDTKELMYSLIALLLWLVLTFNKTNNKQFKLIIIKKEERNEK